MIKTLELESRALGRAQALNIIEPDPPQRGEALWVILALHGGNGSHNCWIEHAGIQNRLRNLPVVAVLPNVDNSCYMDSVLGAYETFVMDEVLPYVLDQYPTRGPGAIGVVGLSMGGWGAFLLALRHPTVFCAAASHSGGMHINRSDWDHANKIFGSGDEGGRRREEYDLARLAAALVAPAQEGGAPSYHGPALYMDCGASDHLYLSNRELIDSFRESGVPYEYHEYPGAHTWEFWSAGIARSLPWLLQQLQNRQPASE